MGGNFIHTNTSFLNTDDLSPCSEEFGNLPSVNKQDARWRLKSMMSHVSLLLLFLLSIYKKMDRHIPSRAFISSSHNLLMLHSFISITST